MVSVIIPCYNVSKYIRRTIESVLKQSDDNVEIYAVNDGSTDKTLDELNKLAKIDSRIHILTQPNKGVSVARNHGLQYAKGDWIIFLDGDDEINPGYIEFVNNASSRYDMILTGFDIIRKNSIRYYSPSRKTNLISDFLQANVKLHICASAYRRDFLTFNNLTFYPGTAYNEDREFLAKALHKANQVYCVPNRFFRYMIRKNSVTGETGYSPKRLTSLQACERIYWYFRGTQYEGAALNHLVFTIVRHYARFLKSSNVDEEISEALKSYVDKYLRNHLHYPFSRMGIYNTIAQNLYKWPIMFRVFTSIN